MTASVLDFWRYRAAYAHGASRDRTGDLLLAKQALSHLSYGPVTNESSSAADR